MRKRGVKRRRTRRKKKVVIRRRKGVEKRRNGAMRGGNKEWVNCGSSPGEGSAPAMQM